MNETLSENAQKIFLSLYCRGDEDIEMCMRRAARAFAKNEEDEQLAFELQARNIWRPNTPVYFNSDTRKKFYSACWVVPLEDSMDGIYYVVDICRKVFSNSAGVGIPIGNLREKDAPIYSSGSNISCSKHEYNEKDYCVICGKSKYPVGKSSGPIIFMELFDSVGKTTKSGGRARRAAILCSMPVWHPDIISFIRSKEVDGVLSNMNISVGITDKFMRALEDNVEFPLHTPYDGSFIRNEDPNLIWNELAYMAWKTADPGIIFLDTVNFYNPLKKLFTIQTTNPCLTGDTKVFIYGEGEVEIKKLLRDGFGKKILSYDLDSGEAVYDFVVNVQKTGRKEVIELKFKGINKDFVIKCTKDHIIFTKNRGKVKADELDQSDQLIVIDDYIETANLIEKKFLGVKDVYDITTSVNHNFFANKILVHNCGEQPLPPFGSCQLSHINLTKFVNDDMTFDFKRFEKVVEDVTRLMDNIIDSMDYPDEKFENFSRKYRPIGIGFMGFSDALFMMDIKYGSQASKDFVAAVTKSMTRASLKQSAKLAKELGKFADYDVVRSDVEEIVMKLLSPITEEDKEVIDLIRENGLRNSQHTTIAPTGTTALSCDCSYGIEPCFGLVWQKNLADGTKMSLINPVFKKKFENEEWWNEDILNKIAANGGSLKNVRGIPKEVKNTFVVAHDISPLDRIELQSACQQHLSSAISSTINLPKDASVEQVKQIFKMAYDLGLKGITIYRDGSKKDQPVSFRKDEGDIKGTFIRPTGLPAYKYCIQLAEEKLYVDIVKYKGRVIEIWLEYGQAGHETNIILKGWGKTLSTALQHGVPLKAIVKQLKGMKGEAPVWFRFEEDDKKPVKLYSVCDALAKLLERYYLSEETDDKENIVNAKECPKCFNETYINVEGCYVCQKCGFSKCS